MKQDSIPVGERKPYKRPVLRTVELATKEVLAIGCKTDSFGPDTGNPTCSFSQCSANGNS